MSAREVSMATRQLPNDQRTRWWASRTAERWEKTLQMSAGTDSKQSEPRIVLHVDRQKCAVGREVEDGVQKA